MSGITKQGSLEPDELALINRVMPLIMATIDDRSWRVRWTAAAKFNDVIAAYDQLRGTMDLLVPAYEKLLQDPEAEVRTAATFNLAHVASGTARVPFPSTGRPPQEGDMEISSSQRITVAERLVKRVTSLTEDDSDHVRAALAMVATELAPILGKESTITNLVPPVLLLLRDAASEVRLNLISSLSALNEVIGVDLLSQSLLPAILDLAQDGKWRYVRSTVQVCFSRCLWPGRRQLCLFLQGYVWLSSGRFLYLPSNWEKIFLLKSLFPFVLDGWVMTLP